jgi:hypothetical protein
VWAVGSFAGDRSYTLILHWDGSQWSVVPSPNPGAEGNILYGIAARAANDIWAVGERFDSGPDYTLTLHWDGSQWQHVLSPGDYSSLRAVTALAANDVWAVGFRGAEDYSSTTLTMHWNGVVWSIVPSPNPRNRPANRYIDELYGVTAVAPDDIWAVGYYEHTFSGRGTLRLHWNGRVWEALWPGGAGGRRPERAGCLAGGR